MARYKNVHSIYLSDSIEILRDEYMRDVFNGAQAPTRIKTIAASGIMDELTEEFTAQTYSWVNISGIVHTVSENDELLGINGRVKIGDTSVLYHYSAISGIFINNELTEIELLTPALAGVYYVTGYKVSELAGAPLYVKVAMSLDRNGV